MKRPRILFVAMHHSIHVARWIRLLSDLDWDLHVFPVNDGEPNPALQGVTLHLPAPSPRPAAAGATTGFDTWIRTAQRLLRKVKSTLRSVVRREPQDAPKRSLQGNGPSIVASPERGDGGLRTCFFEATPGLGATPIGADRHAAPPFTPEALADLIERLKPDLVHSLEFQHAGYLTLAARETARAQFPAWIATNWGSDIFLFGRDPAHARRIREVLSAATYYTCECRRDVHLARAFGFAGEVLPVLPNSGGFDFAELDAIASTWRPPSHRRVIMVKGYEHFAGRAMTAISILEEFADRLRGYEIVLFSVSAAPRVRALELRDAGILNIRVIDWAPHQEILREFSRARIYLGVSVSDGISTSALEAMAMGAFPIQSDTACCDEWFIDGVTGFAVPPGDRSLIAAAFARALEDDALVDAAASSNRKIIRERADANVLKGAAQAFYAQALASQRSSPSP